jgi:hypothetical protein
MQHSTFTGELAERKRNALEAAWLGQLSRIQGATATHLDTTDDLYNYLLIDTRSGWQLSTSVVAQVIASLQQYINNILFGSEPGYGHVTWQDDHPTLMQDWQTTNAQYDVWAANVMLAQYPENYLAPPLRISQTRDFAQMVSDLNQGPLNDDTILSAVQGYLNRFEEVANLSVVSGYIAGTYLQRDDYYFLGRTASLPHTYYWRKCAMHLNTVTTMVPDAWTDWLKVDLPLGADNVVGLPRPVILNNRLHVSWFERRTSETKNQKTPQTVTPITTLTAQMAYLKFDGTWSVPQMMGSTSGTTTDTGDGLYSTHAAFSTLALQFTDAAANPFLYIGLYSAADAQCPQAGIANDSAMVCTRDAWMNTVAPHPDAINSLFGLYAVQTLASKNHNPSVVNPLTTSQSFLQRAIGIPTTPHNQVTDTSFLDDALALGKKLPHMTSALGKAEVPNTVVIDTSDLKNSQLVVNFTPGATTIPFTEMLYGDGNLKSAITNQKIPASYRLALIADHLRFTAFFPDDENYNYINSRLSYCVLTFTDPQQTDPTLLQSITFNTNDSTNEITIFFGNIEQVKLENFKGVSFEVLDLDSLGAGEVPDDLSKNLLSPDDVALQLYISNGDQILQDQFVNGIALAATDHCSATLPNLDLSTHSDYTFDLHIGVGLWTSDQKTLLATSARHALTALHFPHSLAPDTDPMPVLDSYTDPTLGTAEFVHFDLKADRNNAPVFAPEHIRLNTLFAKELVKSAQGGLDHLFEWNAQLTPEPNLGPGTWLTLTLPAYNPIEHGKDPACRVMLYPKDGLHYPLRKVTLTSEPTVLDIFITGSEVLFIDVQDGQGDYYQIIRVFTQIGPTFFVDNSDQVVVAFQKNNTPIYPQVMNDAPWGGFKRYGDFSSAATEPGKTLPMDFSDANGLYFWELFYHTPAMVAYALQSRGQHADARRWQQRVFNPSATNRGTDSQGNAIGNYWNVVPISPTYAKEDPSYAIEGPTDPDALAYANPEHFRKASYMDYVRTQIALGDFCYRQLTPDSLDQALQIYTQTSVLLGTRPDNGLVSTWQPITLEKAASDMPHGAALGRFEEQLASLPSRWSSYPTDWQYPSLRTTASSAFSPPINAQLLMLWDTLDARRYNLRHSLDINGNALHLPLFATPLDPAALLASEAQGGTGDSQASAALPTIAPYRYTVMSEKARGASELLSAFGQQLLRALEAKDDRQLDVLGQTHLADLWTFTQQAQQQTVDIANNTLATLNTSLAAARQRHDYYQGLANGGRSALESDALAMLATSSILMGSVAIPSIAAGVAALAPNIFGLADGGSNWAGPLKGIANGTMALGFAAGSAAEAISMQAGFERRQTDWQQQAAQATADIATLNSQIKGQQTQVAAAKTNQALATAQHQQVMATYRFLSSRFTNVALYQWLVGQLSALYYQAYDATLSLCLTAQTCWQYELGDFTSTFIPTGGWNSQYQGLLAGETLRLSLLQMDNAWLLRNARSLNITRSISLREQLGEKAWTDFIAALKTGNATFSLSERDFDLDYPGHYLRQIASVSVSLPALVGPYQNVRATLTQTGSSLVLKPDLDAVKFLKDSTTGSGTQVKRNLNASQEIALSAGLDDNGTFVLGADDPRYLPFEGTGAISDWVLAFPNPTSAAQQQLLGSLNDIVVSVRYTARNGGSTFADQVLALWQSTD